MPSKALLRAGEVLDEVRRVPGAREAVTGKLDVAAVLKRRDAIVNDLQDDHQVEPLKRAETWRQSSSAQTRSSPRPRAHSTAAAKPRTPTSTVRSPSSSPILAATAAMVCELLCMSAPSTIMALRPFHFD
jgi:hypothetical protein